MKHIVLIVCLILAVLFVAAPVTALSSTTIPGDSITSITPAAAQKSTTVTVTIIGVNFTINQGDVWLERSGEDEIDATSVTWSTTGTDAGARIVCKFKPPTNRETGKWNLVVEKSDGTLIVKTDAFSITEAMTLTSISPSTARADDDDVDFTLKGTNLADVEEVFLFNEDYEDNVSASNVDPDDTEVKGTFDLTDAEVDAYDVCVQDSSGATKCSLSFTVSTDEVGSIDISSNPSGASIFIGGLANGTTPHTIDDLPVGSYKVILRKAGYEEWGKTVTVTADATAEVDAKLYAVSAATPTPVYNPGTVATTRPTTARTTLKSTLKIPTTWADVPSTAASPVDPIIVIGAAGIGIGLVVLRRR